MCGPLWHGLDNLTGFPRYDMTDLATLARDQSVLSILPAIHLYRQDHGIDYRVCHRTMTTV